MKDNIKKLNNAIKILKDLNFNKDPFMSFNINPLNFYNSLNNENYVNELVKFIVDKTNNENYKIFFIEFAKDYLDNIFNSYSLVDILEKVEEKEEERKRNKFKSSTSKLEFSSNPLSYLIKEGENDIEKAIKLIEEADLLFKEKKYYQCRDVLLRAYNYNGLNVNLLYNLFLINYIIGDFALATDFLNKLMLVEYIKELEYYRI
ncbi:MAG: hypothetical protein ACP5RD_05430 [bacterium]